MGKRQRQRETESEREREGENIELPIFNWTNRYVFHLRKSPG